MCKATPNIHTPYAIFGINCERYVDKSIKLIEKVPELLAITGFFKSSLIFLGYKMSLANIKTMKTIPIEAQIILKYGCVSFNRFPRDNNARISPQIGIGIFSIMDLYWFLKIKKAMGLTAIAVGNYISVFVNKPKVTVIIVNSYSSIAH